MKRKNGAHPSIRHHSHGGVARASGGRQLQIIVADGAAIVTAISEQLVEPPADITAAHVAPIVPDSATSAANFTTASVAAIFDALLTSTRTNRASHITTVPDGAAATRSPPSRCTMVGEAMVW